MQANHSLRVGGGWIPQRRVQRRWAPRAPAPRCARPRVGLRARESWLPGGRRCTRVWRPGQKWTLRPEASGSVGDADCAEPRSPGLEDEGIRVLCERLKTARRPRYRLQCRVVIMFPGASPRWGSEEATQISRFLSFPPWGPRWGRAVTIGVPDQREGGIASLDRDFTCGR